MKQQDRIGYLFLCNTIFFFSTYEVVNKLIVGKIDALQMNFIRFLIGGVILLLFALFKREARITAKDLFLCTMVGSINVAISMTLINLSLSMKGSSAGVTAVLFSCNPIFVSIFASIFDRERFGLRKILAILLGIGGTIVISLNKMQLDLNSLLSPSLTILSAMSFGLYTVLGKKISGRIGSLRMNAYSFIGGSMVLLVLLLVLKRPILRFEPSITGWVLYLGIIVTGFAYLTYFKGLGIVGAGKGSLVFFLKPVFATILAILFLNESINALIILGISLILVGLWLIFGKQLLAKAEYKLPK